MTTSLNAIVSERTYIGPDGVNGIPIAIPSRTGKRSTLVIELIPDGDAGESEFEFLVSQDGINFAVFPLDTPILLLDATPILSAVPITGFAFIQINLLSSGNDTPITVKVVSV